MRSRTPLGAALLVFAFLSSSVPAGATPMVGGGGCLLTVTATFSVGVKLTPTTSTMSWGTSSPTCGGTAVFTPASATGDASPPALVTCNSIAVSGSGKISYDGLGNVNFNWTYAGGTGAGLLVLEPIGGLIVGTIALASVAGLANCELPSLVPGPNVSFAGQTSVTYTGVLTWAEVVL